MTIAFESIFFKMVSILTKLVGYGFIIQGVLAFVVAIPVIAFSDMEVSNKIALSCIVLTASALAGSMGYVVLKFASSLLNRTFKQLKEIMDR